MQIIQTIREKAIVIVIIVIALSLIGFILMDALTGNKGVTELVAGKVNGKKITTEQLDKRTKMVEQQYGQNKTGMEGYYAREQAWNQLVEEMLTKTETDKLGIMVSDKEVSSLLLSNDPNNPFLQSPQFKDSLTGKLDIKKAQAQIAQIKALKGEQRDAMNQSFEMIKEGLYKYKYSSLITGSAYYPDWMQKADIAASTGFSMVNYVMVPYTDVSDSGIVITDADVAAYEKEHPAKFKLEENTRKISFIAISQKPSRKDSNDVYNELLTVRQNIINDTATPAATLVTNYNSTIAYKDAFQPQAAINPFIFSDSSQGSMIGKVFGPYTENNNYILAKVLDSKLMPDSAKARHILFQTADSRNPNNTNMMPEAQAKKMADSVLMLLQAGVSFDSLCQKYSYDFGSKQKGGDLGYFTQTMMVPEFSDFCFNKNIGERGVVKTEYGYHIIEVTGQKNPKPAYKIAYIGKDIITSEETINNARDLSDKASSSKDKQALEAFAKQNGLTLTTASGIKEHDFMINGLPNLDSRELIKWANAATVGAVSQPANIGDQYIVAVLEQVQNKGDLMDAATAKPMCEAQIKNQKKFNILKARATGNSTLETLAATYGKSISIAGADSSLTFASQSLNGTYEPKVIGAAFNKKMINKVSQAIQGETGVYYIQVLGNLSGTKPAPSVFENEQAAKAKAADMRNALSRWADGLKKQAEIVDDRSKFY